MNFLNHVQEIAGIFVDNFSNNVSLTEQFLKTHHSPVYLLAAVLALLLLMRMLRSERNRRKATEAYRATPDAQYVMPSEVATIAGDNPVATKLDLAKAYIEMDKKHLAKSILLSIQRQGTEQQKKEAQKLFESL